MKKIILFSFIMGIAYHINAQCDTTLPVYQNFSNTLAVNNCWSYIDADDDNLGWYVTTLEANGNKGLKSSSNAGSHNPDNWVISPAINLPASGSDVLTWKVRATYWQYDAENYSVYVATGNNISDFLNSSSVSFTENLEDSDASGAFANRSLDISSLAGQTVYVAFRHHNVTDQFEIDIDDFYVSSSALGIEDFNKENFKFFYSKDTQSLIVKSANNPISSIKIYNILGQSVVDKRLSDYNENLNLSALVDGMYIAQIEIDNTVKSIKFLKQ